MSPLNDRMLFGFGLLLIIYLSSSYDFRSMGGEVYKAYKSFIYGNEFKIEGSSYALSDLYFIEDFKGEDVYFRAENSQGGHGTVRFNKLEKVAIPKQLAGVFKLSFSGENCEVYEKTINNNKLEDYIITFRNMEPFIMLWRDSPETVDEKVCNIIRLVK